VSTLDALQAVLAGEHACVYGYGALGPHAAELDQSTVSAAYETHLSRRDMLTELIRARSAEPVASLPAYAVPFPVHDPGSARRFAGLLEERLAALYADLIAVSTNTTLRDSSARALLDTAVLAAGWTGRTTALPGIDPPPAS
jgi:Domain of unknown function (DUF4439)